MRILRQPRHGLPAGLLLLGLLAGLSFWFGQSGSGVESADASEPVDSRLQVAARRELAAELGDSLAGFFRELKARRSSQGLERRFRGDALQSPGSLRAVQGAADRIRAEGTRLLARSDSLGRALLARADSMQVADPALQGLSASFEEVLEEWRRDLAGYLRIEGSAAAELHALAGFLLRRQQSFYLEAGQPRFLSRDDALDYREQWDRLARAAGAEAEWARQMQGKRPSWMANVPVEGRPVFGQPLIQRP